MEFSIRPFSLPSPMSPSLGTDQAKERSVTDAMQPTSASNSSSSTIPKKRPTKSHVLAACSNCQKAHLACDVSRPCKRCLQSGREDTCFDVQHKKRGRPRRRDQATRPSPSVDDLRPLPPPPPAAAADVYALPSVLPPGLVRSCFSMTCPPGNRPAIDLQENKCMMTIFLSMELCCARVSDESLDILGIYPHEFAHRSLYDFIHSDHADQLAQMHRSLLDNANNMHQPLPSSSLSQRSGNNNKLTIPPTQRTTAECFATTCPSRLLSIANGSQTLRKNIAFRTANGSHLVLDARFYLGGGLGADLFQPSSLGNLYIVCVATTDQLPPCQRQPVSVATTNSLRATALGHEPNTTTTTMFTCGQSRLEDHVIQEEASLFHSRDFTATSMTKLLEQDGIPSSLATSSGLFSMLQSETSSSTSHTGILAQDRGGPLQTIIPETPQPIAVDNSNNKSSSSPMSPASADIAYPPDSPSGAMLNDEDIDSIALQASQSVIWPATTTTTTTNQRDLKQPPRGPYEGPLLLEPMACRQQQQRCDDNNDDRMGVSSRPRPIRTPRIKLQEPNTPAAAVPGDPRRYNNKKGTTSIWVNPRDVYFQNISSSRLCMEATSVLRTAFPYQSPSAAMISAIKHSRPEQAPSSTPLNPIATHHRIPNIKTPVIPRIPPDHCRRFLSSSTTFQFI